MITAQITLEALQFDQGLPLLVAQRPVRVPQWQRGEPSFPAVIPGLPAHLLITLSLAADRTNWSGILKANRVGGDGSVAAVRDVAETPVTFDESGRAEVSVLAALTDPSVDVGLVSWNWHIFDGTNWLDLERSDHEIAITIRNPTAPWTPTVTAGRTLPWWEVIRYACEAARGTKNEEAAAYRLTLKTFEGWGGRYKWHPARHFATNAFETPSAFDCAAFLRLLDGEEAPDQVDCSDLAAVLSTFANVLGCSLQQTAIGRSMDLNPILLCGHKRWESRFNTFGVHEFTINESGPTTQVWDGSLTLSSDTAPNRPGEVSPEDIAVATGMPEAEYLDRLLVSDEMTIEKRFGKPSIRPIGPLPTRAGRAS